MGLLSRLAGALHGFRHPIATAVATADELQRLRDGLANERVLNDAVFASSPIGLAFVDRELRFLRVNEVLARINGLPASEHIGRRVPEVLPVLWPVLEPLYSRVLGTGERVLNHELSGELPAEPGETHHWLSSFYPVRDGGRVSGVGVAVVDITERKRIEQALARSERLYRAIGESINYGVWVCDSDGRNVYASDSFLRLVGITQEQCSSFGWGDVLHPDDAERTIAAWKECARSLGSWDIEHRFRGTDGRYHPCSRAGFRCGTTRAG